MTIFRPATVLLAAVLTGLTLEPAGAQRAAAGAAHAFHALLTQAMERMHHDMDAAPMSDNPDRDFLDMMLPHHQGAIDAAEAELLYGKDPQVRRLAEEILTEQQLEIELMGRLRQRLKSR